MSRMCGRSGVQIWRKSLFQSEARSADSSLSLCPVFLKPTLDRRAVLDNESDLGWGYEKMQA